MNVKTDTEKETPIEEALQEEQLVEKDEEAKEKAPEEMTKKELIQRVDELQEEVRIQKQPGSLEWHMAEVKENHSARILSEKRDVLGESDADLVDDLLSHIPPGSHGLIIDRMVDQKVVDYAFGADLAYIAAPDFSGIVKKPVSLKLMKIS